MIDSDQKAAQKRRRALLLKQLYQWHWMSSAVCLIGMILFAITGITLNHAAQIEGRPKVTLREARLPQELLSALRKTSTTSQEPLPAMVSQWLSREMRIDTSGRDTEWSAKEIYIALPRPGGDAWATIDLSTGDITHEATSRGWIAYLNDLHKGRHTGASWRWFIDLFSVAAVIFSVTGLLLLQLHATRRPATWPVVGIGFALPVLLLIFFVHQ
ncbi:PepSY-associated TM helix domain-containing protein [Tardiphaga sp.]|uniref:PepSY-associated TM helix domain-containing protein n=1 Tax=Tardiphaga sp. TaxID=1926292 RepID=UPI0037D9A5FC